MINPSPFKVVERNGNSIVIESDQGVQYRRNVTHLKRFHERDKIGLQNPVQNPDLVHLHHDVELDLDKPPDISNDLCPGSESKSSHESLSKGQLE